jgi:four helix bundle protein
MKYIRSYKKLEVYTIGKELVLRVYELLKKFPKEEQYALCDQLRRAVISVPSNVAEGLGRLSEKEQVRFIEIAYGSLLEVETQLDLACDLRYITEEDLYGVMVLIDREARLLSGLRSRRMENPVTRNP